MRRAKIVCTLGPASSDPKVIGQLIDEGMNVARINFSHGDKEGHRKVIETVRTEAKRRDRAVGVLQDLQGPKIRVGRFVNGKIELEPGSDFLVTVRDVPGDATQVSTTYAGLPGDVKRTWILTTRDRALSVQSQRDSINALGGVHQEIPVAACHELMISHPEVLARILIERCHSWQRD